MMDVPLSPCAALFNFGDIELEQIIDPAQELLPMRCVSQAGQERGLLGWGYRDSPILALFGFPEKLDRER